MLNLKEVVLSVLVGSGLNQNIDPNQYYCMTEAVFYEARGEGLDGMNAVAHNILNRTVSSKFPSSICGVVYQRNAGTKFHQYSYRNDVPKTLNLKDPKTRRAFADAAWVSLHAMKGNTTDPTHGALYYFNPKKANPRWARGMLLTARINNHHFYKEPSEVYAWERGARPLRGYSAAR